MFKLLLAVILTFSFYLFVRFVPRLIEFVSFKVLKSVCIYSTVFLLVYYFLTGYDYIGIGACLMAVVWLFAGIASVVVEEENL